MRVVQLEKLFVKIILIKELKIMVLKSKMFWKNEFINLIICLIDNRQTDLNFNPELVISVFYSFFYHFLNILYFRRLFCLDFEQLVVNSNYFSQRTNLKLTQMKY
jgi:hypothetical protein